MRVQGNGHIHHRLSSVRRAAATGSAALLVAGLLSALTAPSTAASAPASASASTVGDVRVQAAAASSAALRHELWKTWEVSGSLNSGFGVAGNGDVYFYDRVARRIHHYAPSGKQRRTWKVAGVPYGVAVAPNGRVVVMEQGLFGGELDRVRIFSSKGVQLRDFVIENDFVQAPIAVAVAPAGDIYVASTVEVVRYSPEGVKRHHWGDTSGSLSELTSLAVAPNGEVFVTDRSENRVKRFSATGELKGQWGQLGTGRGQFGRPTSVAVDRQGRVYVGDPGQATASRRVQIFTAGGKFLGQIGGPKSKLFESTPRTVGVDAQGRVFVYDDGHHWGTRIRSFRPVRAATKVASTSVKVKGRSTKVRLRCTQGDGTCRGTLTLKHKKQTLAKRKFAVKAGKSKVMSVKLSAKGKRTLTRQKPKRIKVVANPQGAKKVTKRVRVR